MQALLQEVPDIVIDDDYTKLQVDIGLDDTLLFQKQSAKLLLP